jgi:hypothetical protein
MRLLPESEDALLLRTDFSDDDTWEAIRDEVTMPVGVLGFQASVRIVDDREYDGLPTEEVPGLFRAGSSHSFVIIADQVTMTHPDHALLILDLLEESAGGSFRAIPSAVQSIENNLSIANMDFEDFATAVDRDGVFRGFD